MSPFQYKTLETENSRPPLLMSSHESVSHTTISGGYRDPGYAINTLPLANPKSRQSYATARRGLDPHPSYGPLRRSSPTPIEKKLAIVESHYFGEILMKKADRQDALLKIEWDILAFMKDQFRDPEFPNTILGSVITISGSVHEAQATTCAEYVEQIWGACGRRTLESLQDALDSPTHTSQLKDCLRVEDGSASDDGALSNDTELSIDLNHDEVHVKISAGTTAFITTIIEQIAWMGAALRTSTDDRIQKCEPKLAMREIAPANGVFTIQFETSSIEEHDQSCWFPLFKNPVIAYRFPTALRKSSEVGLEIPLDMMAALGGVRHALDFEGGLVLKGYSTLFVPIKRYEGSVQWHLICARGEDRISYAEASAQCPKRARLEDLDHEALSTTRTFLGWWEKAETHLATADADYESIDWSKAKEAGPSFRLTGLTLGVSKTVFAQMNFALGAKDGPYHFSQQEPFQNTINRAETRPVLLYDQEDRRAWLVSALAVILHIIQLQNHMKPFVVGGKTVQIFPLDPSKQGNAAREAVIKNKSLELFDCEIEGEEQHCFRDAILDIWSILDRLLEKEGIKQASPGISVNATCRKTLHGWEFKDVANQEGHLRQKTQVLEKTAGQCYDLVEDTDTIVLFARGFGDIIRPTFEWNGLCRKWSCLPKGKDYLAALVSMLEIFYAKAGHRQDHLYLTSTKLQWNRGSMLFEPCRDGNSEQCKCDRTQQIYRKSSLKTFGNVQPPGKLEENGCVVFGQAHHPFKPRKRIPATQNALHMQPETSIQNGVTTRQSSPEVDQSLLPLTSRPVAPRLEEVNGYTIQSPEPQPPPLSFIGNPLQDQTASLKRKRRFSNLQEPKPDTCSEQSSWNDELSSIEGHMASLTVHQPVEHDKKVERQAITSTKSMCASEDVYAPAHRRNHVRQNPEMGGQCHQSYGFSCPSNIDLNFQPPSKKVLVDDFTYTHRNATSMIERRERRRA